MGDEDDKAEDDRIAAFKDKVAAQAVHVFALIGSKNQQARDRKVLDLMRHNEAQATLNRYLTRNADDPLDIKSAKAAE